jgi:hypothetical protein
MASGLSRAAARSAVRAAMSPGPGPLLRSAFVGSVAPCERLGTSVPSDDRSHPHTASAIRTICVSAQ